MAAEPKANDPFAQTEQTLVPYSAPQPADADLPRSFFQVQPIIGRKLGQYKILEKIGQGGMGSVFKAFDTALDRIVAVKVFFGTVADDPKQSQRFLREARSLARLSHANLLHIYNVGIENDCQYFAMDLLVGETLSAEIRRRTRIDTNELLEWTGQVLTALHYIHRQGIIHRDIKSGNIMICGRRCVLMDFGLIKDDQMSGLTSVGTIVGTPDYMPPEAVEGLSEGPPTDLYSLGVVLYEALTGKLPFTGRSAMSIIRQHMDQPPPDIDTLLPEINPALAAIVHRCLAKKSADRYADCTLLAHDLARVHATPELTALSGKATHSGSLTRVSTSTKTDTPLTATSAKDTSREPRPLSEAAFCPTIIAPQLHPKLAPKNQAPKLFPTHQKNRGYRLRWLGLIFLCALLLPALVVFWRRHAAPPETARAWCGQTVLQNSSGVSGEKLRWIRFVADDPDPSHWYHEIERKQPDGQWKRERILHADIIGNRGCTFEFLPQENSNP